MKGEENICKKKFVIGNKLGLHARPAAMFVKMANTFTSDIWVKFDASGTADVKTGKYILSTCSLISIQAGAMAVT